MCVSSFTCANHFFAQLSLKLVFVRPDLNDPLEEGSVRISVLPVRVNLDQDTAYFLHNFFLDISLAPVPLCLTDPHSMCSLVS